MRAVARLNDTLNGHGCFGPHVLISASGNVKCNGLGIARVGDSTSPHSCGSSTHSSSQSTGSLTIKVNGLPVARVGDLIACGSTNSGGSPNVRFG